MTKETDRKRSYTEQPLDDEDEAYLMQHLTEATEKAEPWVKALVLVIKQQQQSIQQQQLQLTQYQANFDKLLKQNEELIAAIRGGQKSVEKVDTATTAEEIDRRRSIVVGGIKESNAPQAISRARDDNAKVEELCNHLDLQFLPSEVYRLGKPTSDGRPRLLKVLFPCQRAANEALKKRSNISSFSNKQVNIRPSYTLKMRQEHKKLRLERDGYNAKLTDDEKKTNPWVLWGAPEQLAVVRLRDVKKAH